MIFIKAYCRIKERSATVNGRIVFESKTTKKCMKDVLSEIFESLKTDYRKFYKMDALSKLGFLASEFVLQGFNRDEPKQDMAVALFNRSSSLEADVNYQKTIQDRENFFPSPSDFVYTLPNIVMGEIAIRNKIYGETAFYVLPQFNSDAICNTVSDLLLQAEMKHVLAGWVEVDPFFETYDCLMALCGETETDIPLTGSNLNRLYNN